MTTDTDLGTTAAPAKISVLVALVYYTICRWRVRSQATSPRDNIEA